MNTLFRSIAIVAAFGSTVAAASAQTAPTVAPPVKAAAAPAATQQNSAHVVAAEPSRHHGDQEAVNVERHRDSVDEASRQQVQLLHVIMPALSGDGG